MESVGIAALTTAVSTLLTNGLQALLSRFKNGEQPPSVASIESDIETVKYAVQEYDRRWKDRSDAWRDRIAMFRRLLCRIQDSVDKFEINKLTNAQFAGEIENIKNSLKEQTKDILDYIKEKDQEAYRGVRGQHATLDQDKDDIPAQDDLHPIVRAEALKDLLKLVLNSRNQQATGIPKVAKVISIVGSGGVGKKCLAAQGFKSGEVGQTVFPLRAFVDAKGMDLHGVLQKLLRELKKPAPSSSNQDRLPDDEQALKKLIREYLISENKRCIIVVCNVQDEELGHAVISSTATEVGGIIIMTTSVQKFAESWICDGGHVYKMRPLSVELSGTLFCHHYTGTVDELKSKEVLKECDGLPLAVTTWASYWKQDGGRCDPNVWSKFGEFSSSRLKKMAEVLQHSYDSLPTIDQQTCLLYFSLFRREHGIRRGSLVRRWMAEGAEVGCGNLNNNDIPAFKNWKMLFDWNAVIPVQVSINEDQVAKTCRPSGAMLGYITSHKSMPAGFGRVCSDEACPSQAFRRLSLQTREDGVNVLKNKEVVSCLRTLVVSPENNNEIKAADLSLDECGLLWVLDLEACSGPVSVQEVCKLKLLKYLSLRSASISYVRPAITQLNELETLDVGKEEVVSVHVDVLKLRELKHLVGNIKLQTTAEFHLRPGNFKAEKLETLAGFVTHTAKGFPAVMEYMSKLRKVKVFFHSKASAKSLSTHHILRKNSYPLAAAIKKFLDQSANHHDRSLSLDIKECEDPTSVLSYLEKAKGKLYSLKLCGTSSFPKFNCQLEGIQKLCISFDTLSWEAIIDVQKDLPQLKYLKLVAKNKFTGISNHTQAGNQTNTNVLLVQKDEFKTLERMCLESAEKTLPKIGIEHGALTKLVSLHLISEEIGGPTAVICWTSTNRITPPVSIPPPLNMLKEVVLHCSPPVNDNNINTARRHPESWHEAWHAAARRLPKSPQVLFIERPRNA